MMLARGVLVLGAALVGGCGHVACGDQERDGEADAPRLESFYLIGQPIPNDPWTLVFGIDFVTAAKNLGTGRADFFLNDDTEATSQDFGDAFRQSGVPLDAEQGSVWMALRFVSSVADGAEVRLGLQLVDAASKRSNCFTLELAFDVEAVAGASPAGPVRATRVACGPRPREPRDG